MKKPELLAPAGSFEKAKTAFLYGADAVYAGTSSLSLRTRAEMKDEDLAKTIEYAHEIGKKVYTAINIYAWDENYDEIKKQARMLEKLNVDGIIVADGGIVDLLKEEYDKRNEALPKDTPMGLETEIFIHGAICFGYSGRCFLSDFLAGRSANLGDCAQSCRWAYNLYAEEKNNPGNLMPVEDDDKGTYIFSSKDLCLIKEIPEIIDMGVDSLKIEGRLKTEYYLAVVVNTYRNAIDDYMKNPSGYDYKKYLAELEKTKTRGLTTFYFNDRNNKDIQEYEGKQYNANYEFGGKVLKADKEKSLIEIKNRLQVGDYLEIIIPNEINTIDFRINDLWDSDTDEKIEFVNPGKLGQTVKMKLPIDVKPGWILRRRK